MKTGKDGKLDNDFHISVRGLNDLLVCYFGHLKANLTVVLQ